MGTDREINNLLNEFLQLETDEQRRQFQGKIAHNLIRENGRAKNVNLLRFFPIKLSKQ